MNKEHHVNVIEGWIQANIDEGCESLDEVVTDQKLFQYDNKSWLCAVTDIEGLFKLYLEMIDYAHEHELPYELEMMLMNLSEYWQLVSTDTQKLASGALK